MKKAVDEEDFREASRLKKEIAALKAAIAADENQCEGGECLSAGLSRRQAAPPQHGKGIPHSWFNDDSDDLSKDKLDQGMEDAMSAAGFDHDGDHFYGDDSDAELAAAKAAGGFEGDEGDPD